MSQNMKVLEAMIDASKRKDHEAFLETMTDDLEYHWHMGTRPIRDKATMRKFLRNYELGFDQRDWTIVNWAEKDDKILVEGVEKIYDRTREVLIDNPFMQVVEFRDGKICKLRDYYDSALVQAPARKETGSETAA
ncbi:MAG: nuclear transport factor 2 family protein [Pseudomonadota bacterium]|uniref:nuclear transport factor 2 family protein n=1 Tax=unclassified Phenylobacterium TaxID=2640670 RepID=UPI0009EC9000|nr:MULTISPECIES: nuclear transport factor 2 family protein [unclassified Phenylobacterium]MBT9469867.1 nuclear transport factor 2 family protein [Phenylobacterium sp.]